LGLPVGGAAKAAEGGLSAIASSTVPFAEMLANGVRSFGAKSVVTPILQQRVLSQALGLEVRRLSIVPNEIPLGRLTKIGPDTWESTAGLIYGPDKDYGNRVKHVFAHFADDISKNKQGVFSINKGNALPLIDEAWIKIQSGSSDVIAGPLLTIKTGAVRQAFEVEMNQVIGWYGGKQGAILGNPSVTRFNIVVENDNNLISAYPIQ
jgi:hypothetical protein